VSEADDDYYIYGLIDPAMKRRTKDDLLSIFYVGKGKNRRMFNHEKEALADLRAEMDLVPHGSKAERIRAILERGETIPAVRLSSGYTDSEDALRAEALAIALVNSALKQSQQPELTNSNRGYHAGFLPMREYIRFVFVEDFLIPPDAAEPVLLVKGDTRQLPAGGHHVFQEGLREDLNPWRKRIKVLGRGAQRDEFSRPGWDLENPWDDDEARERARRYWPIGRDTVRSWLEDPESMPRHLLLAIPSGADTVVRYAWQIDVDGDWEYHLDPDGDWYAWGVPLGRRDHDHRLLGKKLLEDRDGKEVQVLQNHAGGWRALNV
jgi:hypothetical protein